MHLDDPEFRLNHELERTLGLTPHSGDLLPSVIAIVGDLDEPEAFACLSDLLAVSRRGNRARNRDSSSGKGRGPYASGAKHNPSSGMPFPAPPPSDPKSYAYRLLLYIMTHGYEGRLGMELINRRGLISYVGSSYNSDGHASWICMTMGVNPDKLQVVRSAFEQILEDLSEDPPAEQELAEAKQHLIGRRISAYQSNEELSAFYAREWTGPFSGPEGARKKCLP